MKSNGLTLSFLDNLTNEAIYPYAKGTFIIINNTEYILKNKF